MTPAPAREEIDALFEILAETGAGGMGTVYEARERATGRKVALKMVSSGPGNYARFALEAEVLSRLDHPGVVSYVAYGETAQGPWLAMEWLEGETLSDALLLGPFDVSATLVLGRALADALAAAHASKIVHRDLKPSNLFLVGGEPASVKVLDFGVARLREDRRELTLTNQIVGTPGYMSPEQARGLRHVDARADLFSLGCVLFRVLTGVPPFDGPDVLSVLAKLITQEPRPVGELVDDVPEALERLIVSLLSKSPSDRPPSAGAVRDELARIMATVVEGPAVKRPRRRHDGEGLLECVVLARPADDGTPVEGQAATQQLVLTDETFAELRDRIESAGGHLRALGGGALLVHVDEHGSSAERARAAARCAGILTEANWQVSIAAGSSERVPNSNTDALDTTLAAGSTGPTGVNAAIDRASQTLAGARAGSVRVAAAASPMEQAFYRELLRAVRDEGTPMESAPTEAAAPESAPTELAPSELAASESAPTELAMPQQVGVVHQPRSMRTPAQKRATNIALALGGSVLGALAIGSVWLVSARTTDVDRAPASAHVESPATVAPSSIEKAISARPIASETAPAPSTEMPSASPSSNVADAPTSRAQRPPLSAASAVSIPSATVRPSSAPVREKWD